MRNLFHVTNSDHSGVYQPTRPVTAEHDQLTAALIWSNISQFVKAREKAYLQLISEGKDVPEFARKKSAITQLKNQLEASKQWGLLAQVRWIQALRPQIATLLPMENHRVARLRTYRRRMLHLLRYCDTILEESHQLPLTLHA
jgi:hypothetical protein